MFKRAQRKAAKLRLALVGPSGSGKTFSALKIAQGIGGRVALVDTERGSGELYSHLMEYDAAQLEPPFSPEKYINAIHFAERNGYDILILDSLSHAWTGEGGVLDMHDRASKSVRNSFAAWREVTPQHNALVDAILGSSCHIIATMRTKTAYEVSNENGKTKVAKVGLAPVQRDGLEYEFTVVMDLSVEGHVASASKDRTGLFDGQHVVPSVATGKILRQWLDGEAPSQGNANASEHGQANPEFHRADQRTLNPNENQGGTEAPHVAEQMQPEQSVQPERLEQTEHARQPEPADQNKQANQSRQSVQPDQNMQPDQSRQAVRDERFEQPEQPGQSGNQELLTPPSPRAPRQSRQSGSFLMNKLHEYLDKLGVLNRLDDYAKYACNRYGVAALEQLSQKQYVEQLNLLRQCIESPERQEQLIDILNQQQKAA